jgi:cytochrome c oxidase accessory protein FixG
MAQSYKVIPIQSAKLYPRAIKGYFQTWRTIFVWGTQVVFFLLPWILWNDRQAVLFDIDARHFFIFNLVFFPKDLIYLALLLIACAFGLFWWTTIAGRLWCGFSCPQTIYTQMMLGIERFFEGDHIKRAKRDRGPWNMDKIFRKVLSHGSMIMLSLWIGITFAGYFTPIRHLIYNLFMSLPSISFAVMMTIFLYAGFTYLFAGIMREQVCKVMCPYARFQGVMFDSDTMTVAYDAFRGEPRGHRKKNTNHAESGLGDCIDCHMCVQVCPTGIDIRNGLQLECIGCGLCIDACDTVMEKMNYSKGLIRLSSEKEMNASKIDPYLRPSFFARFKKPRSLIYGVLILSVIIGAFSSLYMRKSFEVSVIRDRASLVSESSDGWLENSYYLNLVNTEEFPQHFTIKVVGLPEVRWLQNIQNVQVAPTQVLRVAVRVQVKPEYVPARASLPIDIDVLSKETGHHIRHETRFLGE